MTTMSEGAASCTLHKSFHNHESPSAGQFKRMQVQCLNESWSSSATLRWVDGGIVIQLFQYSMYTEKVVKSLIQQTTAHFLTASSSLRSSS